MKCATVKLPDIQNAKTTREKIDAFLDCIEDKQTLDKIYRYIQLVFFRKGV